MRTTLWIGTLAMLLSATVHAQQDRWRRGDDYGYGARQDDRRPRLIDRVVNDLERGQSSSWMDNRDRRRFESAIDHLRRFEERWYSGRFDNGKLDHAISDIQHLVDSNRLRPREREMLANDVYALREFRSTRGLDSSFRRPY